MRKLILTSIYCFIFISVFIAPYIVHCEHGIRHEDRNRSEIVAKFKNREISSLDSISSFIHIDTVGMNGALDCIIQIFTSSDKGPKPKSVTVEQKTAVTGAFIADAMCKVAESLA